MQSSSARELRLCGRKRNVMWLACLIYVLLPVKWAKRIEAISFQTSAWIQVDFFIKPIASASTTTTQGSRHRAVMLFDIMEVFGIQMQPKEIDNNNWLIIKQLVLSSPSGIGIGIIEWRNIIETLLANSTEHVIIGPIDW